MKTNWNLKGDLGCLREGLALLAEDYRFTISDSGIPVTVHKWDENALRVTFDGKEAKIWYGRSCEFFRAFGILLQKAGDGESTFEVKETARFDTCGAMVDLSHGALLTVDAIKSVLRKMAMMGLNMFMLYREESYHVPGYEYFGYMRGRHTDAQIKEIDDYADKLGIEIIPAIQTIGHLANTLHWNAFRDIKDTDDCLLVGEEKTYQFIEAMLKAAKAPLRSKRIHIGFDETMSLGTGKYMTKHGHRPRIEIYLEHLNRVAEIVRKMGLEPMIWSDMFFRLKGSAYGYAIDNDTIPQNVIDLIPENIELVEAVYAAISVDRYRKRLAAHAETGRKVWFAGAVHDWEGFCVNYYHSISATEAALHACKKEGVRNVFCTTWGDDSPERDFFCDLLGFQLYAEHMYRERPEFAQVMKRFDFCGNCSAQMILDMANIDNPHGYVPAVVDKDEKTLIIDGTGTLVNPSKYLMWQDPIAGIFDLEAKKFDCKAHFLGQRDKLAAYQGKYPEFEKSLKFYISLCEMLSLKADFGVRLMDAYETRNTGELQRIVEEDIPAMLRKLEEMWENNRTLWFERHQAFGFEVLERRYGTVQLRLKTTAYRLTEYLSGSIAQIEELEEKRLPATVEQEDVIMYNDWLWTSTAWGR